MALQIQRGGKTLPNRVLYYGSPGCCKSTFGAFAPDPLFILSPGETGLLTLVGYGRVPERDFVQPTTFGETLGFLADLHRKPDLPYKTIVLDVVNGQEQMCHTATAAEKFGGDMKLYLDFDKGPAGAVPSWRRLFAGLDAVREKHRVSVVCLAHSAAVRSKNPDGVDYDKHAPLIHAKLREPLMQWADIILFAKRVVGIKNEGIKKRADFLGNLQLFCTEGATHEAKNRVGLPGYLDVESDEPSAVFGTFATAMRAARERGQATMKKTEAEPPKPVEVVSSGQTLQEALQETADAAAA